MKSIDLRKHLSSCCKALVKVGGKTTHYYECQKCLKACSLKLKE